jgi:3-methyladenine DNA glycosylase AlkD
MKIDSIQKEIYASKDPVRAKNLARFFKTGKGEYGEGDIFLGIQVPRQREIAKKYVHLGLDEIQKLLSSKIHEERLIALLILTYKFNKARDERKEIFEFYLKNSKHINNWDLVDLSAPKIAGNFLFFNENEREILYKFAKSKNLWEKRIAILSTFEFIKNNEFQDSFDIAKILLQDEHDLIHKAVGWMLREIGKKDIKKEEEFLKQHYKKMPRTMLRYAIEKFNEKKRKAYLQNKI